MKKLFTLFAIALFVVLSCAKIEEQIPEEVINPEQPDVQSLLPDIMTISSDNAPATKAGAIDAYDDKLLAAEYGESYTESMKNKVFWNHEDKIDYFGYGIDGQFCKMEYETDCSNRPIQSCVSDVTIRKTGEGTGTIKTPLSIGSDGLCIAMYPAGIVYDGDPDNVSSAWNSESCTLKLNLPDHYALDETSRDPGDFNNVRGMKLQAPMLGVYFLTNDTKFYNLCGVLKVNFSGIANGVKYFKVTTPGKKINGEFVVTISSDAIAVNATNRPFIELIDTNEESEQTIKFEYENDSWNSAINFNHDLYIPLPVGTYDQISVDVYDASNVILGHWETSSLVITRNKLSYISSYAVEDIIVIEDETETNIDVSQLNNRKGKGVAVNFSAINNSTKNYTLYYGEGQKPQHVYITGSNNTNVGVISGNLNESTIDFIDGTFEGSTLTTAANTLNIRKGATVKNIIINGGNAKVAGEYQNIVVDENATADGSNPVTVTINPTATAIQGNPTVTLNAPSNVVIVKPENSSSTSKTTVAVVVNGNANDSYITVGENVVADITAAANTDVNVDVKIAGDHTKDADGAITIHEGTPESAEIIFVWDGVSKSDLTYNQSEDVYEIYSAAQLAQFAADVNSGNTYAGKTVRLMSSINLDNKAWTPIGLGGDDANADVNSEAGAFLGTFDGNGKTVSNLKVTQDNGDRSFAGLFGNITSINHAVTIQNLTVSGVDIESNHMAAGILGRYYGKTASASLVIDNCRVEGTNGHNTITSVPFVNGNKTESGNQAAGIVGNAYGNGAITITDCAVDNVNINGARDLGGIAGYLKNSVTLTGNAVSNTTITQSYPDNYEAGKDMSTVHEVVGRTGLTIDESNTAENVTIIMQGGTVVARIGNTNYFSLEEAFNAVPTTGVATTITLLTDATLSAPCIIESGKNIILNLGTHNISGAVDGKLLTNNGTLTINADANNPGGIWNTDTNAQGHDAILNQEGATLTINGGHFGDADTDKENANAVNRGAALRNFGTAILNGGTFTCIDRTLNTGYAYPIINGEGEAANELATITIKDGVSTYGNTNGSLCANGGTMTVEGGDFTLRGNGSHYSVYSYSGVINVTGGTFVKNYQGCSGGSANIFCVEVDSDNVGFPGQINISGGSFTKNSAGSTLASSADHISITGGTYNVDPSALVASGYEAYQDGSVWKIREAQGVAKIGTTSYASLAAAVAAAKNGDIIELIADDDISLTNGGEIEINKSLTITGATDAQGNPLYTVFGKSTVTGTNDIFITGSGEVTLSNLKIKNFGNNASTNPGHAPIYVSTNFTGNINLSKVYVSDFNRGGIFLYGGEFNVDDCYIDCANPRSGAFTKGIEIKGSAHGTISDTFICNMERSSADYSTAGIEIYGNGSIEVDKCTIVSDNGDHAAKKATYGIVSSRVGVHNPSGGTTHINECMLVTTNACLSVTDSDAYGPVNNYTFIVDDCDFNTYIATWSTTSSITINSGSFAEDVYADAGTITIHGGEFANFAPYAGSSGSIIIYGGVFDADPSTYVAEGYEAVQNGNVWIINQYTGDAGGDSTSGGQNNPGF